MGFEKEDHKTHRNTKCICETLLSIKKAQDKVKEDCLVGCYNQLDTPRQLVYDTIPFILQTAYGNPFFTWGGIGTEDCFVTVFFKVVSIDPKKCCAKLKLLKPNISIIDPETDCVEICKICEVDYVTETSECIIIELNCYNALKCLDPSFVKSCKKE